MALHSFATDTKLFRDVADALFRGNQGKYCQLAIAQEVQPLGKVPPITGKLLDGHRIDCRTNIDSTRGDSFKCAQQFLR